MLQNPKLVPLTSSQFDVQTAADKYTFAILQRCRLVRSGIIVNGPDTGGCTIKFDKTAAGAAAASRGDGDLGSIVIPAANHEGDAFFDDVAQNTVLVPGDRITVQVTAEGVSALNVVAVLLVEMLAEEDDNETYLIETA